MATENQRQKPLSESESNARYVAALRRFSEITTWQEYFDLSEEFHALGTYKDSAKMYDKCVKAAAAPAYRAVKERLEGLESPTSADFREAARTLQRITDYQDAREVMRVYTVKANALAYEEATALVSNSAATTEELGRGVELLREIKTYRDSRNLLERFEKYYFQRMYAEGMQLLENGHVYTEFEEAAEIFEKISVYSDAAAQAAAARKKANKTRPRAQKKKAEAAAAGGDEVVRVKGKPAPGTGEVIKPRRRRRDDETTNTVVEIFRAIDKRKMVFFLAWLALFIAAMVCSVVLPTSGHEFFTKYQNETRGATALVAILAAVMSVRYFLQMLTASMRERLGKAALRTLQKLATPIIRAVDRALRSIGIDLSRRGRLGGRDEKTFVFREEEVVKKKKKRLKNDLKWQEQPDNAARVRFIFIDYMIRRIRGGYFMKRSMTPAEIGQEIALEEDEKELFRVYDMARYSGGRASDELTDAMIGALKLINQKRS